MGQRNARIGSATKGCGYARHDLVADAGIVKNRHLLRATSEDKRVSPLETNHLFARFGFIDEHLANFFLLNGMASGLLAYVDLLAPLGGLSQKITIHQVVIDQDVAGCDKVPSLDGYEARITRTCPDEIDFAYLAHSRPKVERTRSKAEE